MTATSTHVTREVLARRGFQAILGKPLKSWQFSPATVAALYDENPLDCPINAVFFCGDPYTIVDKPGIFFDVIA